MTESKTILTPSRRNFVKTSGIITAAATTLTARSMNVHAAENNTIQVALVGCGGRGTGAASNALSVPEGNLKLVAMADVFENKMSASYNQLEQSFKDKMDVPPERRFIAFDGYKQAMDCLKPGDIVVLSTPPAFRWVMFKYAIERGLNVFMEKPVTVDAPTSKRMLELGELSVKKNLKVGVGLMCRHCETREELYKRIKDGAIGEILMLRAYRMAGPTGSAATGPKPKDMTELMYQINRFHGFLWASGGGYSDFLIHNIDECCWMKDDWPVEAKGSGGRHYRGDTVDQNFDNYSVEHTFGDGTKLFLNGRTQPGCHNEFASFVHGSKAAATISAAAHTPAKCKIYKGQKYTPSEITWEFPADEKNPYQLEWNHLVSSIREDKPYNEVKRGVMASAVTSMGRMAAHTGQVVTFDDFMDCEHEFAPGIESFTFDSDAPVKADADGKYPVPQPGLITEREYA